MANNQLVSPKLTSRNRTFALLSKPSNAALKLICLVKNNYFHSPSSFAEFGELDRHADNGGPP